MHYLITISNTPDMIFRLEFLINSINKFSNIKPKFSVVVNQNDSKVLCKPLNLKKTNIENSVIKKNCSVYSCEYSWEIPAPARWYLEPESEMCVLIDADVVVCKNLFEFENLDPNFLHGVSAYRNHLSLEEWDSINFQPENFKYYLNFGVVVVPSLYLRKIGDAMFENLNIVLSKFPNQRYFAGQIALAKSLVELKIPVNLMPSKFNWYDLKLNPTVSDLEEIVLLHYMCNRSFVSNSFEAKNCFSSNRNEYTELISKVANRIYSVKFS